jgi:hypothetical protein
LNRRTTDRGEIDNERFVDVKMIRPNLLTRMKERNDRAGIGIDPC